MSDPTYQIIDWDKHFENAKSRSIENLRWLPMPNSFDGDRIAELISTGGAECYGAWCAFVLIASKCATRGILVRKSRKPYTSDGLETVTGIDKKVYDKMIPIAIDVGLIEVCADDRAEDTQVSDKINQVSQNRMEDSEENLHAQSARSVRIKQKDIDEIYDHYPRKVGKARALASIKKSIIEVSKREDVHDAAAWMLRVVDQFAHAVSKWSADDRQYIPHPSTWFNGGRYDDDQAEWVRMTPLKFNVPPPATTTPMQVPADVQAELDRSRG